MKTRFNILSIAFLMASTLLPSCSMGRGDRRDSNFEQAVLTHLDSTSNVEYVGMSDVHTLEGNRLQSVVIYYVTDSIGNRIERNARIITNADCSEVYTWENLDTQVIGYAKQMVSDKLEENGINMDGNSLIDALIELKKR